MPTVKIEGKDYVIVPKEEWDRVSKAARLPALPDPDENGHYSQDYMRVSIVRDMILRREAIGWSQAEAARRAGLQTAVLCRLETGKVTPSIKTVDKLDRAYSAAEGRPHSVPEKAPRRKAKP